MWYWHCLIDMVLQPYGCSCGCDAYGWLLLVRWLCSDLSSPFDVPLCNPYGNSWPAVIIYSTTSYWFPITLPKLTYAEDHLKNVFSSEPLCPTTFQHKETLLASTIVNKHTSAVVHAVRNQSADWWFINCFCHLSVSVIQLRHQQSWLLIVQILNIWRPTNK